MLIKTARAVASFLVEMAERISTGALIICRCRARTSPTSRHHHRDVSRTFMSLESQSTICRAGRDRARFAALRQNACGKTRDDVSAWATTRRRSCPRGGRQNRGCRLRVMLCRKVVDHGPIDPAGAVSHVRSHPRDVWHCGSGPLSARRPPSPPSAMRFGLHLRGGSCKPPARATEIAGQCCGDAARSGARLRGFAPHWARVQSTPGDKPP